MNHAPLISVVIPCLNEEKYLSLCLESFARQTFTDFEVIVSDGGSTDKTEKIASQYRAKFIVHPHTTVTLARQKGIEASSGKIIVGADADTVYPPTHLQRIVDNYQHDDKIVAVGGGGIFEKNPWWAYWGWKIAYDFFGLFYKLFKIAIYIPAFNLSFKKEVFVKMGGYNTYLDFGGDELDILARLKKVGKVHFDETLSPHPSSRRANIGFWRLMIKHTLIDYYLNYILAKIFKRTIIKGKPIR